MPLARITPKSTDIKKNVEAGLTCGRRVDGSRNATRTAGSNGIVGSLWAGDVEMIKDRLRVGWG